MKKGSNWSPFFVPGTEVNQQMHQLENAIWQGLIFQAAIGIAMTVLMFYVLYLVVRAAVRDGVREGMGQSRAGLRREPGRAPSVNLPDMRAD